MVTFLPVSLNITDKQMLIVEGGRIASHKIGFSEINVFVCQKEYFKATYQAEPACWNIVPSPPIII